MGLTFHYKVQLMYPCARDQSLRRSGGVAVLILNFQKETAMSSQLHSPTDLTPKRKHHSTKRIWTWFESRDCPGALEKNSPYLMPGLKPRVLDYPRRSRVTELTRLQSSIKGDFCTSWVNIICWIGQRLSRFISHEFLCYLCSTQCNNVLKRMYVFHNLSN